MINISAVADVELLLVSPEKGDLIGKQYDASILTKSRPGDGHHI